MIITLKERAINIADQKLCEQSTVIIRQPGSIDVIISLFDFMKAIAEQG